MEAVLFDMDGVIVDSEDYWEKEQPDILRKAGVPENFSQEELTGMNEIDQYHYLEERFDLDVTKEEFFSFYDEKSESIYGEKVKLLPNFKNTLKTLQKEDLKTGLVSSSVEDWINQVLDRFDLGQYFDLVLSAEHIESESKPNPRIYLEAAEDLGVKPEECLVVEDSENGVEAAKSAGMYCIGLDGGKGQDLSLADQTVQDRKKVAEHIKKLT